MVQAILVAAIAAFPPTLVALLALRRGEKTQQIVTKAAADVLRIELSINSRMTELLKATGAAARAEGRESMSSTPDPVAKKE